MEEIKIQRAAKLKEKPDPKTLGFGKIFSDHMFLLDYHAGQGWHDPRIVPYGPFMLDPSAMVFHYAQEVFEGLKAYRAPDGSVQLFRPADNARRMADSCDRLCIPPVPEELFVEAVKALVKVDADWVPNEPANVMGSDKNVYDKDARWWSTPYEYHNKMCIRDSAMHYKPLNNSFR